MSTDRDSSSINGVKQELVVPQVDSVSSVHTPQIQIHEKGRRTLLLKASDAMPTSQKTEHFYESIPGHFTFAEFYSWLVDDLSLRTQHPHIVEVGCYHGKSAAYLGVELKNRFPPNFARLDLVDRFNQDDGSSAQHTLDNLRPIIDVIGEIHAGESWDVATKYQYQSLDAVFIDSNPVSKSVYAWLPKVKIGGIIAGHDFSPFKRYEIFRESIDYAAVWAVRVEERTMSQLVVPQVEVDEIVTSDPTNFDPSAVYTREWFMENYINDHSQEPAWDIIADGIIRLFRPELVVDIGCGPGFLVHAFEKRFVQSWGVDGSSHAIECAVTDALYQIDMTRSSAIKKSLGTICPLPDVVTCTEVADRLEEKYADILVQNLTCIGATTIIVTAASHGQEATVDSINVQLQDYWIRKFETTQSYKYSKPLSLALQALWRPAERLYFLANNVMVFERS